MVIVECENCKKNVNGKKGYQIDYGKISIDYGSAGMYDGLNDPKEVKGDGVFCSLKCIHDWIRKLKKRSK